MPPLAAIKMKILITLATIFLTVQSIGQKASFKEMKFKPRAEYYNSKEFTIIFPIVLTKNQKINKLINEQIKIEFFGPEDEKRNLKTVITEHINEYGLVYLSYQTTYNGYGLLSFSVTAEGCGAYCSNWNTYFTFDLTTGKKITISDIIFKEKIDSFKTIVKENKISLLNKYKEQQKESLLSKDIDSTTYDWIISQVDENCISNASLENLSISSNSIEIIDPCEFPHAIRALEPEFELKYNYNFLSKFLKPRFKTLLK